MDGNNAHRFLVVDDDPDVLDLIESIIRQLGFDCHTAGNGLEAMAMLRAEKYPLVITDIQMPGMNGAELLKEIRRCYPETAVIVISGYFDDGDGPRLLAEGAADFLTKPFLPEELEAKIIRCLRKES